MKLHFCQRKKRVICILEVAVSGWKDKGKTNMDTENYGRFEKKDSEP